jgi:hypothetical protein
VEGGRGGPLTLRRWEAAAGRPLPSVTLVEAAVTALPSADQTHLLASERAGKGGPSDPEYLWSVFSLETGGRVGEVRSDVSAAPFFVWKDALVFRSQPRGYRRQGRWVEEPLQIRALPLRGGAPLWERPVRDTAYRGVMPPTP